MGEGENRTMNEQSTFIPAMTELWQCIVEYGRVIMTWWGMVAKEVLLYQ